MQGGIFFQNSFRSMQAKIFEDHCYMTFSSPAPNNNQAKPNFSSIYLIARPRKNLDQRISCCQLSAFCALFISPLQCLISISNSLTPVYPLQPHGLLFMVDKVQKGKNKTCLVSSLFLGNKHWETFQNVTFHQNSYHQHLYETLQRLLLYMVGIFIPFSSTPQNNDVEQQLAG